MNILRRLVARLRGQTDRADAEPMIVCLSAVACVTPPPAANLALARDKRRLERLLRDRGITRLEAASIVHAYFQEGAT